MHVDLGDSVYSPRGLTPHAFTREPCATFIKEALLEPLMVLRPLKAFTRPLTITGSSKASARVGSQERTREGFLHECAHNL